eukprot:365218-Chlamydomonas_euryale.AAC.3
MGWVRSLPDANVCQRSLPTVFRKGAVFGKGACRQSLAKERADSLSPPARLGYRWAAHRHTAPAPANCTATLHTTARLDYGWASHRHTAPAPANCTATLHVTARLDYGWASHRHTAPAPANCTATLHTTARLGNGWAADRHTAPPHCTPPPG